MKINFGETILRINISFAAAVTLTLIIDESGLCAAALFCCVVHEAGHIICLLILGEKPKLIELSFYGIKLERKNDCVQNTEEIAVYASGPLANLVLSAVIFAAGGSDGIRMAALISLCVGAFNMLPCAPLDGGNILHFVLNRITDEEKSGKISFYISFAVLAPMTAAGIILLLKNRNITLLAVSGYLVLAAWRSKKSALS
ncbi:MAG: site-2 protease family protein [Clostridia bacterium]|nr:site-2 protease family protein [Clostridia bacterium]